MKLTKFAAAFFTVWGLSNVASAFTISDIRLEGIVRTEPGTVFSHLPFQVGDEYSDDKGDRAIHSLYRSGLFKDISLSQEGDVIVVNVVERPAVSTIETAGIKAFDKELVEKSLRDVGLSEGRIFDKSTLDRADQELRRQYLSRGYYGVSIVTTVTPVERNRVRVNIKVDEGQAATIASVRLVGVKALEIDDVQDQIKMGPTDWLSWYTKRDLYARERLMADIETIRSYYHNQGFLDFKVDSVQVSISPNKSDVYITINVTEGKKYTISSIKLEGDMLGLEKELEALIDIEKGSVYNEESLKALSDKIVGQYSRLGYAFASANPAPNANRQDDTVEVIFTVDPGRRAYVRRVNITGNNRTHDEVIRREVRQYESAWFDSDKVALSRDRIDRLGFFEMVTAEPKPVAGTRDQVDLDVHVQERATGSVNFGAGYSSSDGIVLSAGFSQANLFGTGKSLGLNVNTSKSQRIYSINVAEPYITPEGISRSWSIYDRRVDLEEQDISDVQYETRGASIDFGIPFTETDRVFLGAEIESTKVETNDNSPNRYQQYVDQFGKAPMSVALTLGWSQDSRDNALSPTRGTYQRVSGEFGLPGMDIQYYKATYQYQRFFPLSKTWTWAVNAELGYSDVYGSTKMFPFFKNFYAGGIGSVRGYQSGSLGPKDGGKADGDNLGGDRKINFSTELLAPLPGTDRSFRLFAFLDGGMVWGYDENSQRQNMSLSDLRYTAGVGFSWLSPVGPLKFSLGFPLNDKDDDELERFQFQIGTGF